MKQLSSNLKKENKKPKKKRCTSNCIYNRQLKKKNITITFKGFPGGAVVKNLPANAGDARDVGSILGSGRSPGEGMATHSSILA